jgi:proline iminopeptidase
MKKILFVLCLSGIASAQELLDEQKAELDRRLFETFISGREFCEKHQEIIGREKGFRVQVPVDYSDPKRGTTEIFAYWAEGFYDPSLPTMIFFDGGSGGNSHGSKRLLPDYNQLHFDQRGIACSRPATLELYKDATFYSSVNNARDAEMIRKQLNIKKLTVYGVSYGTVPATIFGHLFPDSTTAVVLEGVVYSPDVGENVRFISYALNKMYESLPEDAQLALQKLLDEPFKSDEFFRGIRRLMYHERAFDRMRASLIESLNDQESTLAEETEPDPINPEGDAAISALDLVNLIAIHCKELRTTKIESPIFTKMANGGYEFVLTSSNENPYDPVCRYLNFAKDARPFNATDYPLTVPVTYFQGLWDGATFPAGAIFHYKHVAQGKAQLMLAKSGGHSPHFENLREESNVKWNQQIITEKAFRGEMILAYDVSALNIAEEGIHWTLASKNFQKVCTPLATETNCLELPKSNSSQRPLGRPISCSDLLSGNPH